MILSQKPAPIKEGPGYLVAKAAVAFATAFGCGYAKKAPGTAGSIPGLAIGAALALWNPDLLIKILAVGIIIAIAFVSIFITEKVWDTHDDQRIVIDEVAGQAIATAFLPFSWPGILISFLLFRFFDIWKPGPIGWADASLPGVWGTLIDDLLAGALAGFVTWILVIYVF